MDSATGIRLLDYSKLAINWKNDNDITICRHHIFWRCFGSPVKFSYWSNFHVHIVIRSGVMTIRENHQMMAGRGNYPALRLVLNRYKKTSHVTLFLFLFQSFLWTIEHINVWRKLYGYMYIRLIYCKAKLK